MSEEMWTEEAEYNVIFEYLSGNRQTYHGLSKNKKRMLRKKLRTFQSLMDFWFTKTHEDGLSTKRIVERFWNLVTQIILQSMSSLSIQNARFEKAFVIFFKRYISLIKLHKKKDV